MPPPTRPLTGPKRKSLGHRHQRCGARGNGPGLCCAEYSLGAYLHRLCVSRHRPPPLGARDTTLPANAYGRSKVAGEGGIRASGGAHAILRTSWVFSAHGSEFVKTMLRLSDTRDQISVVDDQIGGPTPARAIAAACLAIAQQLQDAPKKPAPIILAARPMPAGASFARAIFAQAGRPTRVRPIPTSAYPTPAARPLNSRLDCNTTTTVFGLPRPDWHAGLKECLTELGVST